MGKCQVLSACIGLLVGVHRWVHYWAASAYIGHRVSEITRLLGRSTVGRLLRIWIVPGLSKKDSAYYDSPYAAL